MNNQNSQTPQITSYTALEPGIIREVGTPSLSFTAGQAVSLFSSISFLWTLGIIACVAAAGFVWVRGGLLRMEASEAGIRKSNEEFKRGSLGLLGVMGLFLIIYTINKGLLVGDVNLSALNSGVTAVAGGAAGVQAPSGAAGAPAQTQPTSGDEQSIRATLAASNITINNNPCSATQTSNCTNVAGLPQSTISMLQSLRQSCSSCDLVITGGTEPGHATHGVGLRPVDLRKTSSLVAFLDQQATKKDSLHYLWGGYTFYDEPAGATSNTTAAHFHAY